MSVTESAKKFNDEEWTGIDTKINHSVFYWKNNKFLRKIHHSSSNLPELATNEGTTLFTWFTKKFIRKIDDNINRTCCCTNQDLETRCQSTLDRSTTAKENTFVESVIYNGENLIYKNQGHNAVIKIIDSGLNKEEMLEYTIEFATGAREKVPREYLSRPENPDVASLPTTLPKVQDAAKELNDQDLTSFLHPISLNPAEQEFIDMHHRLFHLPYSIFFRLSKAGLLPKNFLRLKDRPPPCASCMFGAQHRTNWQTKSSKHGKKSELRKEDLTKPGQCVGVDQMIYAQPGLIPQDKGNLNRARIWACTVFVD